MDDSTSQIDLMSEYETTYILGRSFRRKVEAYIERCHLEDGGYFFARVLPSSGIDTYFAVKSLSILGMKPEQPQTIGDFFLDQMKEGALSSVPGLFAAVEVMNELGQMTDDLRSYALQRLVAFQNKAGAPGAVENIRTEVPSNLEQIYRAIRILKIIGADFDEKRVARFVFTLLNPDGGYGRDRYSTLVSTFYATEIHKLLGVQTEKLASTKAYLRKREGSWLQVQFIEDLFWLVKGLANLGEKSIVPDRVVKFVMACQRRNGGFSRAMILGIPTLEHTFYALSILREIGVL